MLYTKYIINNKNINKEWERRIQAVARLYRDYCTIFWKYTYGCGLWFNRMSAVGLYNEWVTWQVSLFVSFFSLNESVVSILSNFFLSRLWNQNKKHAIFKTCPTFSVYTYMCTSGARECAARANVKLRRINYVAIIVLFVLNSELGL